MTLAGANRRQNFGLFQVKCGRVFTTKDTKTTKFGVLIIRTLRVLRDLRGEADFFSRRLALELNYTHAITIHNFRAVTLR
jgi:alkylhydroperoxidase family enzyme